MKLVMCHISNVLGSTVKFHCSIFASYVDSVQDVPKVRFGSYHSRPDLVATNNKIASFLKKRFFL